MFRLRLKDIDVMALIEALEEVNPPVTELDLSYNEIGDPGARAVARFLKVKPFVSKG
jgi:hypothetical protein